MVEEQKGGCYGWRQLSQRDEELDAAGPQTLWQGLSFYSKDSKSPGDCEQENEMTRFSSKKMYSGAWVA